MKLAVVALLAACGSSGDSPVPSPETHDPKPIVDGVRPIVGESGAVTHPAGDGGKLGAGGFPRGDKRVAWKLDGDAIVVDGTRYPFAGGEVEVDGMRLRRKRDDVYVQRASIRRGTLALPGGKMAFAVVGDGTRFGDDGLYVGFDANRDGALDVERLDSDELYQVAEKTVSLDGWGYRFEVAKDGSKMTLTPMGKQVAARPSLAVGSQAVDFSMATLDGNRMSLGDLRGKVVLLDFWSTSCQPCIEAMPKLRAMRDKRTGFEIVGVADGASERKDVEALNPAGLEGIDDAVQSAYRIDRFPSYFVVGKNGQIACAHCKLSELETVIDDALGR